jgi:hypothetical protein
VAHLTERITGTNEDGSEKIFRDSAVDNLSDFFERFRSLNVRSNPQLDDLVTQAQRGRCRILGASGEKAQVPSSPEMIPFPGGAGRGGAVAGLLPSFSPRATARRDRGSSASRLEGRPDAWADDLERVKGIEMNWPSRVPQSVLME